MNGSRCDQIQGLGHGVVNFCRLNDNTSCSVNLGQAWQMCIPILIAIVIVSLIVMVIIGIAIGVVIWKRRHSKMTGIAEAEQSLLEDHYNNQTTTTPVPIPSKYSPPNTNATTSVDIPVMTSNRHRSRTNSEAKVQGHAHGSGGNELGYMTRSHSDRDEDRKIAIHREQGSAENISKRIFNYNKFMKLPDLGSRLMKYWFMRETKKKEKHLQVTVFELAELVNNEIDTRDISLISDVVSISKKCQLTLEDTTTVDILKSLFSHLTMDCHLLPVLDIATKDPYVSFMLTYSPTGSVRDYIFHAAPTSDWCEKYDVGGGQVAFSLSDIARCGQQVLEAVEILYSIGFPYVGQIHSGNVFMFDKDRFVLGGYENTLLGYRTSCFKDLKAAQLLDKIDVIMFGHLLFEMYTKCTLIDERVLLTDFDYEDMETDLQEVLQQIFKKARKRKSNKLLMKEISILPFFKRPQSTEQSIIPEVTPEVFQLIAKVFLSNEEVETGYVKLDVSEVLQSLEGKYTLVETLPKLGWRFGKVWAKVRCSEREGLLTAVNIPYTCPVYVKISIEAIKQLLLLEHEHIYNLRDIDYVNISGNHVVVTFQDIAEEGSLKDKIHNGSPFLEWDDKYKKKSKGIKDDVAMLGRQILHAMTHLSHLDGRLNPLSLGYVHSGNIFVSGGSCRLGGFENALLGYRSRHYRLLESYKPQLDIFMFGWEMDDTVYLNHYSCRASKLPWTGHLLFEMCTGRELATAQPSEKDYKSVPKDVLAVLKYIFEDDSAEIEGIMQHDFFAPVCGFQPQETRKLLGSTPLLLLEKVRKAKPRNQENKKGERNFGIKMTLDKTASKFHRAKKEF